MFGYRRGKARECRVGGFPEPERAVRGAPEAPRVLRGKVLFPRKCASPAGAEELTGAGEIPGAGEYQTIVLKLYWVGPG